MPDLQSNWEGLNQSLLCEIYPVKRVRKNGDGPVEFVPEGDVSVKAPLTESNFSQVVGWNSPFEGQTADAKLGTLSALLQAGDIDGALNALNKSGLVGTGKLTEIQDAAGNLQGRMGITRLNSVQIMSAMAPAKLSCTMVFRALSEPKREVEDPVDQLTRWSLPRELAPDGFIANAINSGNALRTVLPSLAPLPVAIRYAGRLFNPMVIESIDYPLTVPRDSRGRALAMNVQISFGSLFAFDAKDWAAMRNG